MITSPSDIHSSLTDERVDFIGHLIERVRAENVDSSDDRDSGWSLGCRAYQWCCSEIKSLSLSTPWIQIIDPSLRFIFKIGNIEVSFYKGTADKPKANICDRAQSYPEIRQLSLILEDTPIPEKLVWAFAVETDSEGLTTNIEFLGMSDTGDVVASRRVPLHDISSVLIPIPMTESVPAELPAAPVSLPGLKKGKAENDGFIADDR